MWLALIILLWRAAQHTGAGVANRTALSILLVWVVCPQAVGGIADSLPAVLLRWRYGFRDVFLELHRSERAFVLALFLVVATTVAFLVMTMRKLDDLIERNG